MAPSGTAVVLGDGPIGHTWTAERSLVSVEQGHREQGAHPWLGEGECGGGGGRGSAAGGAGAGRGHREPAVTAGTDPLT